MRKNLKAILTRKLGPDKLEHLNRSFDTIGDIAIIKIPQTLEQYGSIVAEAIMQTNKHIKTVLRQASSVTSDYRLRKLEWIGGERKTETIHKENGCIFKVDLKRCYFSPRLIHERMRIARQIQPNEVIVNMFAGVGCYSIVIAKHSKAEKIFSIDINPAAFKYMRENIKLNEVSQRTVPLHGDASAVIQERLQNVADRVLLPLPNKAYEYLHHAKLALKSNGGRIHYYDFEHAERGENPIAKVKARVAKKLRNLGAAFEAPFGRVVRTTGPRWYQVVVDITILQ